MLKPGISEFIDIRRSIQSDPLQEIRSIEILKSIAKEIVTIFHLGIDKTHGEHLDLGPGEINLHERNLEQSALLVDEPEEAKIPLENHVIDGKEDTPLFFLVHV